MSGERQDEEALDARRPEPDAVTAESMLDDADFGAEHTRPTVADENTGGPHRGPDESEPEGRGGDGGMDPA